MKLIILAGPQNFQQNSPQTTKGMLVASWDGLAEDRNMLSIPGLLRKWLTDIRAEHMRWAYDMGKLPTEHGKLANALQCGEELSMWWTSLLYERHPKLSPELFPIYKLRCLERLINEQQITSVQLLGGDRWLRDSLQRLCAANSLGFGHDGKFFSGSGKKSLLRRIYDNTPAPLRALARLVHWLWKIKRHLPCPGPDAPGWKQAQSPDSPPAASIVTYFPNVDILAAGKGIFHSRYWENLHEALNAEARLEKPDGPHFVRWLFIRFPSPQLSWKQCLDLRNVFQKKGRDGLSFNYLEEFITFRDIFASLGRWLRLCARSLAVEANVAKACHFTGSSLDFWPLVRNQWRESMRGWRCLERCLQNRGFQNYCKRAGKLRWLLFPLENCPWERMLTTAAHKHDTPVYGAQHSVIRPTDFRYFDDPREFSDPACSFFQPDVICGNGRSALSQWLANGLPKNRLRQVEALRYLYLGKPSDHAAPNSINTEPEPGEPLLPYSAKKLLVLTSFFADETDAHLSLLKKALETNVLAGWQIRLKPHPYLSVAEWLNSLPSHLGEKIIITDAPMSMALSQEVSVWASNSTTTSLEAALKGIPLMVMLPPNDFDLCPVQDIPGLLRTGTLEDVAYGLANMKPLDLPPDYLDLDASLHSWKELLGLRGLRK